MELGKVRQNIRTKFTCKTYRATAYTRPFPQAPALRAGVRHMRHFLTANSGKVLASVGVVLLALSAVDAVSATPEATTVEDAVRVALPGATIVTPAEIDSKSCAPIPNDPTLLRADFNGDGREDVAVIAKLSESNAPVQWHGETLHRARLALALFLDNGRGGYTLKIAKRFSSYIPLATYIDLIPIGTIHNRETGRSIQLRNPGIALVFCEKSTSGFYFHGHSVRQVPLVD